MSTAQLNVLDKFTASRKTRELKFDVEQRTAEEAAKKRSLQVAMNRTKKLKRMVAACQIAAASDGILIYANDPNRVFGRNRPQIEEGATVRERQLIFRIFDLKRPLRVNARIPEVSVTLLTPGMKARVRVDAFPDTRFSGVVTDVAPLPDPTSFFSDDRKVYTTHVLLKDGIPDLRPGMLAHVEIIVKELDNALCRTRVGGPAYR